MGSRQILTNHWKNGDGLELGEEKNSDELELLGDEEYIGRNLVPVSVSNRN
jgi:hypothetical protein